VIASPLADHLPTARSRERWPQGKSRPGVNSALGSSEQGGPQILNTNNRPSNHISLIDSNLYANWVFSDGHPTQGRRFTLAAQGLHEQVAASGLGMTVIDSDLITDDQLLGYAHSPQYITEVTRHGLCDEWSGQRQDLANLAQRMAGGTVLAVESLLQQTADISVHFAGAKHHAMRGNSSGFASSTISR
jgi:acetoin utilization deacetylase AcuC-like enzyme